LFLEQAFFFFLEIVFLQMFIFVVLWVVMEIFSASHVERKKKRKFLSNYTARIQLKTHWRGRQEARVKRHAIF